MNKFFSRYLLKMVLGASTYDYMCRSIRNDPRTTKARNVDIVVRKDSVEKRTEADWIKTISRIID